MPFFKNLKEKVKDKLVKLLDVLGEDVGEPEPEPEAEGGYDDDCPKNSENFYSTENSEGSKPYASTAVLYSGFNLGNGEISIGWIPDFATNVTVYTYSPDADGNYDYPSKKLPIPACDVWDDFKQSIENGNWGQFASDNFTHNPYMNKPTLKTVNNAYNGNKVLTDLSQN